MSRVNIRSKLHSLTPLQIVRIITLCLLATGIIYFIHIENISAHAEWVQKASIAELETVANDQPWNEDTVRALCYRLIGEGRTTEAEARMARLLTYHPHSIEDWIGYARCAANCNHLHKAFDAYQRVLSFDPHNADALIAIGQIEARAGLYTDGLHHIQQGLAINPKASVDTISYISCLIARAQWLEAWQWITPILKVNPTYDDLYPYVYRIARHLGKLQEAAEYFHTRIQIGNEEPPSRIHAYLALIKVSQAKTPQDYLAAAKEAQQEVWAPMRYYAGAVILFQCHDLTHALKLVNKGLSLHPGDIALLQLKETIYQTQHKQTLAHQISDEIAYQEGFTPQILILQKRVAQNPQDIGLELQLARALQQHGNYAAAAEVYQQVLQRHPHDEEALQQLLLCRQNALDSLDIAVKQGKL